MERWREKVKDRRQAELRLQASGRVLLNRCEALVYPQNYRNVEGEVKEIRDCVLLNIAYRSC